MKLLTGVACMLVALAASAAGPATAATTAPAQVHVSLSEYKIAATPGAIPHGKVTFVITNNGMHEHELVVVKTDKDATKLLTKSGRADETGSRGELEDLQPGKTRKLTLQLPAGHYVLLCNIGPHYKLGMRRNFKVT